MTIYRVESAEEPQYEFPSDWLAENQAAQTKALAAVRAASAALQRELESAARAIDGAPNSAGADQSTPSAASPTPRLAAQPPSKERASKDPAPGGTRANVLLSTISGPLADDAAEPDAEEWRAIHQAVQVALADASHSESTKSAMSALCLAVNPLVALLEAEKRFGTLIADQLHPRFVYFSSYKEIHGAVLLGRYLEGTAEKKAANAKPATPAEPESGVLESGERLDKRETIDNLFFLAGIEPQQLQGLRGKIGQLGQYLRRASRKLTDAIQPTWLGESRISAEVEFGDDILRVKIADIGPDGTRIREQLLQRRSQGFRWYFSFHVNFTAETQRGNLKEAILLLDEPGLHLHPAQQSGVLEVMRQLSTRNQLLYSTHSPFMIGAFDLGSLFVVEPSSVAPAAQVSESFWDADPNTILPILHALGAQQLRPVRDPSLARALPPVVVLEGETDALYLKTVNCVFRAECERDTKRPVLDVEFFGTKGAPKIGPCARLHSKMGHRVVAVYDNEPDARRHAKELRESGMPEGSVLHIEVEAKPECDIEDMFGEGRYLKAVNEVYRPLLRSARFTPVTTTDLKRVRGADPSLIRIVPAIERIWAEHATDGWGAFSKGKVCEHLCVSLLEDARFEDRIAERFEGLFKRINDAAAKQVGPPSAESPPPSEAGPLPDEPGRS
ncbi:MAG: AAA family ATPase [Planctomycetales bacterium]|nr:AAA family ATPase [Planctomycetales bacterium]